MELGFFKSRFNLLLLAIIFCGCTKKDKVSEAINSIENVTVIMEYENSNKFMGQAYCYFVFQRVLDPVKIPPTAFSKYIKGGTLSLKHLKDYETWLEGEHGKLCKSVVGKEFDTIESKDDEQYMIFLNTKAIINEGKSLNITLDHEKLHVAFSLFKTKRDRIEKLWKSLSKEEQRKFKESHPGYNFSNNDVKLREFFAYRYQENIREGIKLLIK